MRNPGKKESIMTKRYQLVLFFVFLCFINQDMQAYAAEQRILRDKYAYETASEMYAVADTAEFNEEAELLISKINDGIKRGTLIDDDVIWHDFQKLEPYRMNEKVQSAVMDWVNHMSSSKKHSVNQAREAIVAIHFDKLLTEYNQQNFDTMIEQSRKILTDIMLVPINEENIATYAIRSNMALALMHQNKDLCALAQLELVRKISNSTYFPALINLTVLYERLGRREEAESLSKELLKYSREQRIKVPLVDFNAAWYELNDYQNIPADIITNIGKVLNESESEKHQTLYEKIKLAYQFLPITEIGLVGKLGYFDHPFILEFFLVANVFLLGLLLWILLKTYFEYPFIYCIAMGVSGLFHIAFWGLNFTGWGWLLLSLNVIASPLVALLGIGCIGAIFEKLGL